MGILANILLIILVFVCIFMVLVILMQRGNAQGGLGAAMGGGMAESALGPESASTLSKLTTKVAVVFFVLIFVSYLLVLKVHTDAQAEDENALPQFDTPTEAAEGETTPEDAEAIVREIVGEAEDEAAESDQAPQP